ncbi:hypothetical protein O6H91_09G069300 [Diphasiastrum complanatum]|uniref:Uncharacterized protein n=1 Tax=Diphasiastrum complanatum TaxID=34168 RepID=A0ACC2CQB0_DIPCM|nr:hypothetical protein O6H91_09G069300 [Diphasiastrum complanatum]
MTKSNQLTMERIPSNQTPLQRPNTDLTPFRRSEADNQFVSSNDVRNVEADCGYTYSELQIAHKDGWGPCKMLNYLLELYRPPQHFVHRWFLVLDKILKRGFGGPYRIRVFIDKPDATAETDCSDQHFAGEISIFARSSNVRCANCDKRKYMRASLNLTKTMVQLGITTAPEMNAEGTAPSGNPLSGSEAITLVFVSPTGAQLCPDPIGWGGPNRLIYKISISFSFSRWPKWQPMKIFSYLAEHPPRASASCPLAIGVPLRHLMSSLHRRGPCHPPPQVVLVLFTPSGTPTAPWKGEIELEPVLANSFLSYPRKGL